jgi:acyl-CoA thioesterase FadM
MKILSTTAKVEAKHLDARKHANFLQQQIIAYEATSAQLARLGVDLNILDKQGLTFVMWKVHGILYCKQLKLDDVIDIQIEVWVSGPTRLDLHYTSHHNGKLAMEASWTMPLLHAGRPKRIPDWIVDIIGHKELKVSVLASTKSKA